MIDQSQALTFVDALAIILSVVSLIITVVGFFASLKFYREGVELQKSANDALTKLEEKTQFIQTQVGGMFDKTLDAAIGKKAILTENFEELSEQLENTKIKIIEESIKQIGAAGEQERKRVTNLVDAQIDLLRRKIEATRESAEQVAQEITASALPSRYLAILKELADSKKGLTLDEISERVNIKSTLARTRLNKLYIGGYIGEKEGTYFILIRGKDTLENPII